MNSNKQILPVVSRDNSEIYNLLLKKARERYKHDKYLTYKPALVTFRNELLQKIKRDNYRLEYDRLLGELEGHADKFNIPGGHWQKDKLTNRLQMLKQLLK
jgi:hypothetical protein